MYTVKRYRKKRKEMKKHEYKYHQNYLRQHSIRQSEKELIKDSASDCKHMDSNKKHHFPLDLHLVKLLL